MMLTTLDMDAWILILLPTTSLAVGLLIILWASKHEAYADAKRKYEEEVRDYNKAILEEADKYFHNLDEEANMLEFLSMNDSGLDQEEYTKLYKEELRYNNPSFFDADGNPTDDYFDWQDRRLLVLHEVGKEVFDGNHFVEINTDKPDRYTLFIDASHESKVRTYGSYGTILCYKTRWFHRRLLEVTRSLDTKEYKRVKHYVSYGFPLKNKGEVE